MHNLVTNFDQILSFAKEEGAPIEKKRGIIREYLQSKFISELYEFPESSKLSFVGGTSLRLMRNSDRFSEDLDFDNLGLSKEEITGLVQKVAQKFLQENISVEIKALDKGDKTYFELKFPGLLLALGISSNPKEKLMIKIDYSSNWKAQNTEVVLLNKYGFLGNVVVNNINQSLVQKLVAYTQRNITQPRDIYDIIWLYSQKARIDVDFAKSNGYENLSELAFEKYQSEGIPENFRNKLLPFLFRSEGIKMLDLFGSVLQGLK